jgi:hypothetical protein
MKKSSYEASLTRFHLSMNRDIDLLMKIESAKRVVKSVRAKRSVFEAFVLSICANWEVLAEELLVDCLNNDPSKYRTYTGFKLPRHLNRDTCKAILIGINYLDFKSVEQLKDVSNNILTPKCNPFAKISASNGQKINEFFAIRNYLAHRSYAAKRALLKIYKNRYNLKTFVEPGVFLLADAKKQKIPRMGAYINNFKETANAMGKFLGVIYAYEDVSEVNQKGSLRGA